MENLTKPRLAEVLGVEEDGCQRSSPPSASH